MRNWIPYSTAWPSCFQQDCIPLTCFATECGVKILIHSYITVEFLAFLLSTLALFLDREKKACASWLGSNLHPVQWQLECPSDHKHCTFNPEQSRTDVYMSWSRKWTLTPSTGRQINCLMPLLHFSLRSICKIAIRVIVLRCTVYIGKVIFALE
jgi:hypothetical protein